MSKNGFWQEFKQGAKSERSLRLAMDGSRVGMVFGGVFLAACLGSYPTYNVLETDGAGNGLACRLASVALNDYSKVVFWLIYGVGLSVIVFLLSKSQENNLVVNGNKITSIDFFFLYIPLCFSVFFYFCATNSMFSFIRDGSQPALLAMKQPLDGYICPPPEPKKSHREAELSSTEMVTDNPLVSPIQPHPPHKPEASRSGLPASVPLPG